LLKKPELGGAVISVCAEVHYLEFTMAASVQGWKKKWFYIKDQKNSSSDQYGIAPFDANKDLKKLSLWDSPPTEAKMEDIKPLLTCIQALKVVAEVRCQRLSLCCSFCNGEFSLFSIVFPNFGRTLAWKILLKCLKKT
jgi:hypothetical protein